jgi:hypothetical protein
MLAFLDYFLSIRQRIFNIKTLRIEVIKNILCGLSEKKEKLIKYPLNYLNILIEKRGYLFRRNLVLCVPTGRPCQGADPSKNIWTHVSTPIVLNLLGSKTAS